MNKNEKIKNVITNTRYIKELEALGNNVRLLDTNSQHYRIAQIDYRTVVDVWMSTNKISHLFNGRNTIMQFNRGEMIDFVERLFKKEDFSYQPSFA